MLEEKLKTGDFKDVVIRLFYAPPEYDAIELRQAMKVPKLQVNLYFLYTLGTTERPSVFPTPIRPI